MGRDVQGNLVEADFETALAQIRHLIATPEWYQDINDESVLCLLPGERVDGLLTAQFCIVRRAGLPRLEAAGQIADLDLREDQGLLEATHIVFLDNNTLGVEYNHFGPRVSRLPVYLERKAPQVFPNRLQIANIVRGDSTAILDDLAGLHLLDLSVLPGQVGLVRRLNGGVGTALAANAEVAQDPEVISLSIKPTRDREPGFLEDMGELLRALVQNDEFRAEAKRLKVQGRRRGRPRIETFDLLKDEITASVQMIKVNPRGRALDSNHAYDQIIQAYNQLRDDIREATAIMDANELDGNL